MRLGDAESASFGGPFDIVLAIGVADYVAAPARFLEKLGKAAGRLAIVSFPTRSPLWTRLRGWRYARHGIALNFFTAEEVGALADRAGLEIRALRRVDQSGGGLLMIAAPRAGTEGRL